MGFNTALMICNDGLHELERDPHAGQKLVRGVLEAGSSRRDGRFSHSIGIGNHCNPVSVLESQHADVDQLVIVGGNTIRRVHSFYRMVGCNSATMAEDVLQALAEELGYNLSKKAWRKRRGAQAIEARSDETGTGSAEGESAVA